MTAGRNCRRVIERFVLRSDREGASTQRFDDGVSGRDGSVIAFKAKECVGEIRRSGDGFADGDKRMDAARRTPDGGQFAENLGGQGTTRMENDRRFFQMARETV